MADLKTMRAQLDGMLAMRGRGVRETMIGGRRVTASGTARRGLRNDKRSARGILLHHNHELGPDAG